MKKLLFTLLSIIIVLVGCNNKIVSKTNSPIKIVVFLDEGNIISANYLQIDLDNFKMEISDENIYTTDKTQNIFYDIKPIMLTDEYTILKTDSATSTLKQISKDDNTLISGEYLLKNNTIDNNITLLDKDGNKIATILDPIKPVSFIYKNDTLSILSTNNAYSFEDLRVELLVFKNKGEEFTLLKKVDLEKMFSNDVLNKLNYPNFIGDYVNVIPNISKDEFIWNEALSLVSIDMLTGESKIILNKEKVATDLTEVDTYTEGYYFFEEFGYQKGFYMAGFPNYNYTPGYVSVFYSDEKELAYSLLCKDEEIILYDKNYIEKASIKNDKLLPISYIPNINN